MIGTMWLNRSCIVVFRLNREWVYYSGWILCEGEKKRPQITVLENKMARHHGTCHPFFFLFFFQVQKQNKKTCRQSSLIEKSWMTSTNWSVWQRPPAAPHIIIFFFSSFFFFLNFVTYTHTHTLVKFVADRFSPSPTMQLTSRKQHLLLQYVHTHVFLFNNIKEEQGK